MGWEKIHGWSCGIAGPGGFYDYLAGRLPQHGTFIEAGVFLGRSIVYMGERRPDLSLWAVDPWEELPYMAGRLADDLGGLPEDADIIQRMGLCRAFHYLVEKHSPEVFRRLKRARMPFSDFELDPEDERADALFIDADHSFEGVLADLENAANVLKPNGLISGHDYGSQQWPGVSLAVDQFARARGLSVGTNPAWGTCWILEESR